MLVCISYVLFSLFTIANYFLCTKLLYLLYCTLFLPYINYCLEIWGNTYISHLQKIYISQKRAIRLVCKEKHLSHTYPLFKKLSTLNFFDIIKFKSLQIIFKAHNNLLPTNLRKYFVKNSRTSRFENKFKIPMCNTTLKSHCLSVKGIKLWNNLDSNLRELRELKIFKMLLKRTLLNN